MDTVPVYYGDIKVTLLNDSHYPDWIITEFMMQRVRHLKVNQSLILIKIFFFRVTFNVFFAISILQRGQISVCQVRLRLSLALLELSESVLGQTQGQLLYIAVLVSDDLGHSLLWTESCNKSKLLTMLTSLVLFIP